MKSWKTSLAGVAAVLGSIIAVINALLNGTPIDWMATGSAFMAGIGLLFAKDAQVTGGSVPQTNEAVKRAESAPVA